MNEYALMTSSKAILHTFYKNNEVRDKFQYVLHLPIESKNIQAKCIAQQIEMITTQDYYLLNEKYKNKQTHIENSILWAFAKLPKDIQKNIIELMMEYNQKAAQAFISTPFIYALNRYSKISQQYNFRYENDKESLPNIFMSLCVPSSYSIEKEASGRRCCYISGCCCTTALLSGGITAVMFPSQGIPIGIKVLNILIGTSAGGMFAGLCCLYAYCGYCNRCISYCYRK